MYNKIASIILNSAKANGLSDVFVAQPDSLIENLAGKIFVLAEIGGKRLEARKIFDFLISALDDNYYNDEKILFCDKIEGLKIENIFEAAIAKTNKDFIDFLASEKIKLNPAVSNISLGVIYENNLHFSTFGRNRALLLYSHNDEYEIINVETNATEIPRESDSSEVSTSPKLFSSVISGKIPLNSYFIFTNETLPEYLSGREMLKIVTSLSPMAAAEQIKNVLTRINTYVPFLGIIIKNTTGIFDQNIQDIKEEPEEISSAHNSISSLNYTEAKTEQMLSPAGLINISKLFKRIKKIFSNWSVVPTNFNNLNKKYIKSSNKNTNSSTEPVLNLGKVKSLNLARSDSFLIKEKIFFKKKSGWVSIGFHKVIVVIAGFFNPQAWFNLAKHIKSWAQGLNTKNRWLFIILAAVVVVFIASLFLTSWNHQRQIAQTQFNNLVVNIQNNEDSIDTHMLYNDEVGAKRIFLQTQTLLSSLPQNNKAQRIIYKNLSLKLQANRDRIEKIIRLKSATKINDLTGLNINNLVYARGKIYGASGSTIYRFTPGSSAYTKLTISGTNNLSNPVFYGPNLLYYWDNNKLFSYNVETGHTNLSSIADLNPADGVTSFKMFYGNLYLLVDADNQIYRYLAINKFKIKSSWFKEKLDLSQSSDLYIDGYIYVLQKDGQVLKFFKGRPMEYASRPITPIMVNANQLIVGNKNIYIFEASSKRLVVLARSDGHLLDQYQLDFLNSPKNFSVDEKDKIAYILADNGIYKISLQQ